MTKPTGFFLILVALVSSAWGISADVMLLRERATTERLYAENKRLAGELADTQKQVVACHTDFGRLYLKMEELTNGSKAGPIRYVSPYRMDFWPPRNMGNIFEMASNCKPDQIATWKVYRGWMCFEQGGSSQTSPEKP